MRLADGGLSTSEDQTLVGGCSSTREAHGHREILRQLQSTVLSDVGSVVEGGCVDTRGNADARDGQKLAAGRSHATDHRAVIGVDVQVHRTTERGGVVIEGQPGEGISFGGKSDLVTEFVTAVAVGDGGTNTVERSASSFG